jgi:uncharacterized membrane protein YphA (DoxX/SURF4 family)
MSEHLLIVICGREPPFRYRPAAVSGSGDQHHRSAFCSDIHAEVLSKKNVGTAQVCLPGLRAWPVLRAVAGTIELVGSLLLLVGLWSREAAFIMSGEIAVAYFMRRAPNGFFPQVNGGGLEVLFCFVFLFLFFAGSGPWSVDAMRRPAARN